MGTRHSIVIVKASQNHQPVNNVYFEAKGSPTFDAFKMHGLNMGGVLNMRVMVVSAQRLISAPLQAFEERGEVLHYRVQGHPPGSNESLLGGWEVVCPGSCFGI